MNKNLYKKILILLLFFIFLPLKIQAQQEMSDYEFYKKNGHKSKNWNELVEKGFEAYDQKNCDSALSYFKQAIAAQCQDALVYYKAGLCSEFMDSPYTAQQYYQLAEEKLNSLSSTHRYQKDIYESMGRLFYQQKKYDQALPYLTRAATLGQPSFGLYYMLGQAQLQKNDPGNALASFEKALSQDLSGVPPLQLSGLYREMAKFYFKNKDFDKSLAMASKAVELNPDDSEAKEIKSKISTAKQQEDMIKMIQGLTGVKPQDGTSPSPNAPPPPAAANLPPL